MSDFFLDRAERRALAAHLTEMVAWLADDLDNVVIKQTNYGGRTSQGKHRRKASDEALLPFNETASGVAHAVTGTMQKWVDRVCIERRLPHPGFMRAKQSADWLRRNVIALALCDDAEEAADEITGAVKAALKTVDRPRRRTYQGQCEVCAADLYAYHDDEAIVCRECEAVVDKSANDLKVLAGLSERSFTAAELVGIVEDRFGAVIKTKTVHDLAYRKANPIAVRGVTRDKQKLYRAGDVFDALRRRRVIS